MPIGTVIGGLGAAGSLISAGSQLFGGGPSGGYGGFYGGTNQAPVYIPTGVQQADVGYQNILQQLQGAGADIASRAAPQYQTYYANIVDSPYQAQRLAAAQQAGQYMAGPLAGYETAGAQALAGAGGAMQPYASQILQTGFDPQSALYNRTQQQLVDQANAINAMYGLSSSPYGAGTTGQALSNFNIDWQNQQLARQAQALQGYGSAVGTMGRAYAGAADLGQLGAQTMAQAGNLPYQTFMSNQQDEISALNQMVAGQTGAYGLDQQTLNALGAYMRLGQSATGLAQAGAGTQFAQNQLLGQEFGQSLGQLGSSLGTLFGDSGQTQTQTPMYQSYYGAGYGPQYGYGGYTDPYTGNVLP